MTDPKIALLEIADAAAKKRSIALVCHISPDPDTLGAAFAVGEALRQTGKETAVFCADTIPEKYLKLSGGELVCRDLQRIREYEAVLALDCGDMGRMGKAADFIRKDQELWVIDHHGTNQGFGTVSAVFGNAASTCEELPPFICRLGADMTPSMANALYRGIITDTGRFSFSSTTPLSLRTAADLIEAGADYEEIARSEYRERTLPRTRLLGAALGTLQLCENNRIAWMYISQAMLTECGAVVSMTDGIVNYAVEIIGTDVGMLMTEKEDGVWKVSLRSMNGVQVDGIAKSFGGGGHAFAAGCTVNGTMESVSASILERLAKEAL